MNDAILPRILTKTFWQSVHSSILPKISNLLLDPTPSEFIVAVVIYCAAAMILYDIHQKDRYQQPILVLGLVLGTGMSISSLVWTECGRRATGTLMLLSITFALMSSVCLHWILHNVSGRRKGTLVDTVRSCLDDAARTPEGPFVPKFLEIVV